VSERTARTVLVLLVVATLALAVWAGRLYSGMP
jgi:hypothetical protein